MIPKKSAQVQKYRFHNKDATLNYESFHNSNFKKKMKKKLKTNISKAVQTWSLNYKKKASKDCIGFIHTLYYPRIKQNKTKTNVIYSITVDSKWKISYHKPCSHKDTKQYT